MEMLGNTFNETPAGGFRAAVARVFSPLRAILNPAPIPASESRPAPLQLGVIQRAMDVCSVVVSFCHYQGREVEDLKVSKILQSFAVIGNPQKVDPEFWEVCNADNVRVATMCWLVRLGDATEADVFAFARDTSPYRRQRPLDPK